MKSHIEVMYDTRYHKDRARFEEAVYIIQHKYRTWFQNRKNPIIDEAPDKIYNHYRYRYDENHEIDLKLSDDLPDYISQECQEAFDNIFNQ